MVTVSSFGLRDGCSAQPVTTALSSGTNSLNLNGPEPTGFLKNASSPAFSNVALGRIARFAIRFGKIGSGCFVLTVTVVPLPVTEATVVRRVPALYDFAG